MEISCAQNFSEETTICWWFYRLAEALPQLFCRWELVPSPPIQGHKSSIAWPTKSSFRKVGTKNRRGGEELYTCFPLNKTRWCMVPNIFHVYPDSWGFIVQNLTCAYFVQLAWSLKPPTWKTRVEAQAKLRNLRTWKNPRTWRNLKQTWKSQRRPRWESGNFLCKKHFSEETSGSSWMSARWQLRMPDSICQKPLNSSC